MTGASAYLVTSSKATAPLRTLRPAAGPVASALMVFAGGRCCRLLSSRPPPSGTQPPLLCVILITLIGPMTTQATRDRTPAP